MKSFYFIEIFALLFLGVFCDACLERPYDLREKEENCFRTQVEFIERVSQTSRSVLNFAKKHLGMEVEDENGPQKCDYYKCLVQHLNMFDAEGYPGTTGVRGWIEKNVVYNEAVLLLNHADKCLSTLDASRSANTYFNGSMVTYNETESDMYTENLKELQNKCEISSEFMRCLALEESKCPIFKFP